MKTRYGFAVSPECGSILRRAVFLDRDDTLMPDVPYLGDPAKVRIFPEARDALRRLDAAGFLLIVASNQSGIARGLLTCEQVDAVNAELARQLRPVLLTGVYYSPDGPDEPSETRKPAPGLLLRAAREHGIDLRASYMVGDKGSDVVCGRNAGCRTIRIARFPLKPGEPAADFAAADLAAAAEWILARG